MEDTALNQSSEPIEGYMAQKTPQWKLSDHLIRGGGKGRKCYLNNRDKNLESMALTTHGPTSI